MNFDPQELLNAVERIRDAFNRAAEADSGSATQLFKKLARSVNTLHEAAADPALAQNPKAAAFRLLPAIMDLQFTASRIEKEAQQNPLAAATLQTLVADVEHEVQSILPMIEGILPSLGLPKIPGLDLEDLLKRPAPKADPKPESQAPKPAAKPQPAPKPRKPKKSNDDFTLD
jgi:hypothetical protein